MIKHNQDGAVSGSAISLVLAIVLLIGAIAFGAWAFSGRQDYKNHTDAKVAAAVTVAKQQEGAAKDQQFVEAEKNPLKTYTGPQAYGSIILQYPKTWSGYVATASTGNSSNALVDGYFDPGVVPSTSDPTSVFSLRVQVLSQSYSQTLSSINSGQQSQTPNPPTINAYALPKVPNAVGVEVTGTLPNSESSTPKTGVMVILPLRSQTLELWTEGNQFISDFNNYILPNFTFSP